jgi:hypothetical protein
MIWIEILGRHGDVLARHRSDAAETRIGRAYDNDVVLDDPTVAPHHLRVWRGEDGRLVAEDLGTANGLYVDDTGPVPRAAVDGDRPLRIGRTLLRIREASHAVAPEREAVPAGQAWGGALLLAVALIALETFLAWLGETTERKAAHYVLPLGILVFLTLVWTSAWAILNRIFAGHARFERHLVIALSALLAFSLLDEFVDAAAFAFSSRVLADYAYVGAWLLLAALCFFHLREIAPVRLRLKAAVVFGLGLSAVAAQTLAQSELRPWNARQTYLRDLKPPFMRIVAPEDGAAFFGEAERLKATLDRARKDEPAAGGVPGFDEED